MKNKRKPTKRIELDQDVVADLESSDAETGDVRGGGGSVRATRSRTMSEGSD